MSNAFAARAFKLVVLGMALFCVLGLWRALATMGLRLPLDPNEGWNAYHAAAAMSGTPLYPGPRSFMIDNYPPLSFYLVGALGRLFGDNIFAGRIIALLSFFFVSFGIFTVALRRKYQMRQRRKTAGPRFGQQRYCRREHGRTRRPGRTTRADNYRS